MKCALVWLPFNDPSMPPLGIASLVGHLRARGYNVDPIDLNIDLYSRIKAFFRKQPEKLSSVFQRWSYDSSFQQAASALAFPDYIREVSYPHWERLHAVQFLKDCLLSATEFLISEYKVIGLSVTNTSFMAAVALTRLLKERAPKILTIWGGPSVHSDNSFNKLLRLKSVDLFINGKGEKPMEKVLSLIEKNKNPADIEWAGIPGAI